MASRDLEDPLLSDEGGLSATSRKASSTRKLANTKFTTKSGSASMTKQQDFQPAKTGVYIVNRKTQTKKNASSIYKHKKNLIHGSCSCWFLML